MTKPPLPPISIPDHATTEERDMLTLMDALMRVTISRNATISASFMALALLTLATARALWDTDEQVLAELHGLLDLIPRERQKPQ